ncbi:EthD family reductase [Lichenibacterium dinghuense]|uniref:EthD family reductase n=1 Tax=Lichenibacterium dinghuense TaxID=2895977 RepID=UPI001F004220|nr:EthD family reductase [Lichenibacterium sp. 6Y81]
MSAVITVLYPNAEDATFDMDYYLGRHMPMVQERFGAHGMTGWRVERITGTPAGEPAPFSVKATLEFGSAEGFAAALRAEGGPVVGDVPNFTTLKPQFLIGESVGHG